MKTLLFELKNREIKMHQKIRNDEFEF